MDTSPPAAANPRAMARPMPRLPPQTMAFLPVKSMFIVFPSGIDRRQGGNRGPKAQVSAAQGSKGDGSVTIPGFGMLDIFDHEAAWGPCACLKPGRNRCHGLQDFDAQWD